MSLHKQLLKRLSTIGILLALQSMLHAADVVPSVGPFAGGNTVAITNGASGTITNVLVDGLPATIQDLGPNWVQIAVPSTGSAGEKDILIQTSDNGDTSLPNAYTVNPPGEVFRNLWMDYRVAFFGIYSTDPKRAYLYPTNTALDGTSRWTYYDGANTSFMELMSTNNITNGVYLRAYGYDHSNESYGWNMALPGYDWIATNAANQFIYGDYLTNRIVITNLPGSSYQVDMVNSFGAWPTYFRQNQKLFPGVWNTGDSLADGDFGTNASTTWQNPGGGGNNFDVATFYPDPDRYITWGAVAPANNAITIVTWPGSAGELSLVNCMRIRGYEPVRNAGVTPTNGSCAGGFEVTITGTNLCNGSDATSVTLCGAGVQSIISQSPTQIVVVAAAPATAGAGDVRVLSTSYGETVAANAFTYEKIPTATTLANTPNPSGYGQAVTFTATVSPGTSIGTVVFKDGTVSLGTAALSGGTATLVLDSLMVTTHSITAEYSGSPVSATSTSSTVTHTVNKATPTITTWPSASAITYSQTLADSTLTGGSTSIPGGFVFTTPTTAPVAGTASQNVTFTPTDTDNYNTVAGTVSVTVNKATPTVSTWPTASEISCGQTLADSVLSGGTASVPGTFAFTTPATTPPRGVLIQSVTFTPTDADNYTAVGGLVPVQVEKGTPLVSSWPTATELNHGQTLASSVLIGGTASVPGSFGFTTPTLAPPDGRAPQTVTFTPTDSDSYNTVVGTVSVIVNADGQAPVAAHDTIQTIKNREVSVSATKLLANDTDADGDTLTITAVTTPGTSGGKVVFAAGTITYTPPTNFIGTDFFSYTVNDGRGYQANANVKVVINSDVAAPLNVVSGPVLTNGQFTVRFTGTPGTTYSVEYSDTINNPVWHWLINVTTPSTSETGEIEFVDPVGTNTNRYYRTVYPPNYDN
jgi:hypothetical protein